MYEENIAEAMKNADNSPAPMKTIKAKILDAEGKPVKDVDGKTKTVERQLLDLDHPNCPEDVASELIQTWEGCTRKQLREIRKKSPELKKAMRQSSIRARRRVAWCLDPIQRADDFMCRLPYGLGLGYRVGSRAAFVVGVSVATRGIIRVR